MKKVFLGGTCAESKWREALIKLLEIDYFNPVVEDWTEECMAEERKQRKECDFCLYTLTPRMKGTYSIAEVIDDSNKRPERTILCILSNDINPDGEGLIEWSKEQKKSLEQVGKMVERNGGKYFTNLIDVADYLNSDHTKFEIGKCYEHTTGYQLHIISEINTCVYGNCYLGENNKGELEPVGKEEANAENYHEISKEKFISNFDKDI